MRFLLALLALLCLPAFGADHLVKIDTRPGVTLGYWWMERPGAKATVVLLPGGDGAIGMRGGVPTSTNFLVRTRDEFAAAGFNVAIVGRPSDRSGMDGQFRQGPEHVTDLRAVVEKLRAGSKVPVWLVGTSRGTISAAAAGIALEPQLLGGIVLTSSITDAARLAPVQNMGLSAVRVPVLVVHHKLDACLSCPPRRVPEIMSALTNAPVKKLMMLEGGDGANGDPCEPMHYHGFIGMEKEAVSLIVAWIRQPVP